MSRTQRIVGTVVFAMATVFATTRLISMFSSNPWTITIAHDLLWGQYLGCATVFQLLALRTSKVTISTALIASVGIVVFQVAIWRYASPSWVAAAAGTGFIMTIVSIGDFIREPTTRASERLATKQ